jgi:hypothetical protein
MRRINKRDRLVPIGFEHIHDAGEVLEKLREIQKAAR